VSPIFSGHSSNCISHNLNWSAIKNYFPTLTLGVRGKANEQLKQHFNSIMENQFLFTCTAFLLATHEKNAQNRVDFSQRAHSTHNQIKRFRLCSYGYGFALNRASSPQSTLQGISKNGKVTVDKKLRDRGCNPVFRCS
jgi:hypothetical protein